MSDKLCMDCGEMKRYQQYRRCFRCIAKIRKEKKEVRKLKAKLRKENSKYFQEKQKKKLHKECWKLMSEVVRRKGVDENGYQRCFTCYQTFLWKEIQAGHRHHNKLDFDFDNIKPQCPQCNTYKNGNLGEYERHLIEEHGLKFAQKLKKKADRYTCYSYQDLLLIKSALEKEKLLLENN